MSAAGVLLASLTLLLSVALFKRTSALGTDNCRRIHTLTATLDRMIADSRESLDAYVKDGTITLRQRDRELGRVALQRRKLAGADCPPRRIPSP